MASTNFDMGSDEIYHSKSNFYYPDKMENNNDKGNIGLQHEENQQNAQFARRRKIAERMSQQRYKCFKEACSDI